MIHLLHICCQCLLSILFEHFFVVVLKKTCSIFNVNHANHTFFTIIYSFIMNFLSFHEHLMTPGTKLTNTTEHNKISSSSVSANYCAYHHFSFLQAYIICRKFAQIFWMTFFHKDLFLILENCSFSILLFLHFLFVYF